MKPEKARKVVNDLTITFRISIRRACGVCKFSRGTYHYKHRRPDQAPLRKRIREIAETRVRYGCKRIHVVLRREGWVVNHKRVHRLYRLEGLQLRNKTPKRKVTAKLREDRTPATLPNECWAMDFMADQLFNGQKIRVLTIVDVVSKLSPAIGVDHSYRGCDVVQTLDLAAKEHGYPKCIRVDNGPEFISKDLDLWAYMHGVTLDFSRPGKPTDNAFGEAFNSRVRQECLNAFWFLSLADARCKIEAWRVDYNTVRLHSALGHRPPAEYVASLALACQG